MNKSDIDNCFTYHRPIEDQAGRYSVLRSLGKGLADQIQIVCPDSKERIIAIDKLRECIMWSNASIACNGAIKETYDKNAKKEKDIPFSQSLMPKPVIEKANGKT